MEASTRLPIWVKDFLSQARSRSKGPLSGQVADATKPCGQVPVWSIPANSPATARWPESAHLAPLPSVPTKVRLLNRLPTLDFGGVGLLFLPPLQTFISPRRAFPGLGRRHVTRGAGSFARLEPVQSPGEDLARSALW